ncbi:MAG TPA: ADP-ribosylglycohydrolase family protein [Actinospica sp.]|nr:ADP-ribosylglycohydrolase family protein [Actinospica sp.]
MADFLRSEQMRRDRARGVLLAAACGDALGVPYEFQPTLDESEIPEMIGGGLGPYEPGEYSDDTQMQVVIARVAATGADLRADEALRAVAEGFLGWATGGASDIGAQTRAVLSAARGATDPLAAVREAARATHERTGRSAGNGSLMRTSVLALAYLNDRQALAEAARAVSSLTHYDPVAAEACVLWCEAVRVAVLEGPTEDELPQSPALGLDLLDEDAALRWKRRLDEAAAAEPQDFAPNGYVVPALQAAWCAIQSIPIPDDNPGRHLGRALYAAVRAGDDTDTVAAIAGALLGAHWGASSLYPAWREAIHGWPGLREPELAALADAIVDSHGGFPADEAE